jgi:anti-sigma factor RsiW
MNHDDLSPNCGRVRNELASFLYGELAPDAREALELHLDGCVPCGEELAAQRETQRLLSRWETPAASEDPRQLARAIAARAGTALTGPAALSSTPLDARAQRRGRLVRWSARLAGAAAGLLFTFSLLNARASLEGGRLQLDFALPGARSDAPASASLSGLPLAGLEEQVRAIAAQEVAARSESFAQSQEELFQRCSQMTQQELLRLSQAVDYAMAQNQRSWDTKLTTLGREAARADLETRRVITDLASYLPASTPTNR